MERNKIKVLLIEDDTVEQLAFERMIKAEKLPYSYTIAGSVSEANRLLLSEPFDIVISDFFLGDGTAFDAINFHINAPVVIITAVGSEEIAVSAMKKGAYDYLIKDIDRNYLKVLPIIVENAVRRKKSDDELQKYRERLMELVAERTQELFEAHEKLKKETAERKQAEAEAIRSSQLASLGELAAGIAHEVNNPINGIINYAQMLVNKLDASSSEHDLAKRIIKESNRIAYLTKSFLSFARDGRKEKRPVNLANIIFDTLALSKAMLINSGTKLELNTPSNLPLVPANAQQIEQVFLNIISNSRYALNLKFKGAHEDNILIISAKSINLQGSPYVRITFHDKGSGIPDNIRDKITDPFFSTKPANIGTGLGLSISHGIISNHGGRISFESIENEFTKVIVDLPQMHE